MNNIHMYSYMYMCVYVCIIMWAINMHHYWRHYINLQVLRANRAPEVSWFSSIAIQILH